MTHNRAGEAIRLSRESLGMNLRDFAALLGVSAAFICDIEKGRRLVPFGRLKSWSEITGIPLQQLVRSILQDELDAAGLPFTVRLTPG